MLHGLARVIQRAETDVPKIQVTAIEDGNGGKRVQIMPDITLKAQRRRLLWWLLLLRDLVPRLESCCGYQSRLMLDGDEPLGDRLLKPRCVRVPRSTIHVCFDYYRR